MSTSALPATTGQLFLERVSPAVRKVLVRERVRAMRGEMGHALQSLTEAIRLVGRDRPTDVVALGLLRAELQHLDLLHDEAIADISTIVNPNLASLTVHERFGVEQNLSDLQFYSMSTDLFYNVADQKNLIHFEWLDYRELFAAKLDADRGKHFETLPVLWRQHRRAYLHGCWLAQRWTNQFLASECVTLREWEDAVHHTIMARYDELMPDIAVGILSTRDAVLVDRIVNRLLMTANLRAHFVVACKLLKALEDAIPDEHITRVGQWLLARACEMRGVVFGDDPGQVAWETIAEVAHRFPSDLARSVVGVAVTHPAWTTKLSDPSHFCRGRREIVQALVPLSSVVPEDDIPELAAATLPLVTERPQIPDYDDVINLICNLADRGGPQVREMLAASLYPSDQPVNPLLTQVADVFGKDALFDSVRLQRLAEQVEQNVRRQVQWLEPGSVAEPVAECVMECTTNKGEQTLKITYTGLTGLHALARHRAKLDPEAVQRVLDAVIDLARNKDNYCSNRTNLLRALIAFADSVPATARDRLQRALEEIARGPVEESSEYATAAEADAPLSDRRIRTGGPEDVQGMALIALATLVSTDSAATRRLGGILEDALCDPRPQIRQAAYAAAGRLADVSEGVILGILSGLRDPDPKAAAAAFVALARQTDWSLNRNHWRVLLMAARLAQRTGDPRLRRHVAAALVNWSSKCPLHLKDQHAALLAELSGDLCCSVRIEAKRRVGTLS